MTAQDIKEDDILDLNQESLAQIQSLFASTAKEEDEENQIVSVQEDNP